MCSLLMLSGMSAQSMTPRTKRRNGGNTLLWCYRFAVLS
jgi:hypothetical protein